MSAHVAAKLKSYEKVLTVGEMAPFSTYGRLLLAT